MRASPSSSRCATASLQVLLWERGRDPFRGAWALPGGLLEPGETLEASIRRHLAAKVDVREVSHLEQLATYSDPARDPTAWELATAYLGLVELGVDPDVPARHAVASGRRPAAHRLRPRRHRARRPGPPARQALVLERRVRARTADLHARRAARGVRRRARPRGLRDEPPSRARASRRDRADRRAAALGPRRRAAGRGLPLPRRPARDHRPVRRAPPAAASSASAQAPRDGAVDGVADAEAERDRVAGREVASSTRSARSIGSR